MELAFVSNPKLTRQHAYFNYPDNRKLYATHDGLASLPEVFENKGKLPSHTQWVEIKGGNHAQFAYYGSQLGDDNATITREVQQSIVNQTVIDFLKAIENQ